MTGRCEPRNRRAIRPVTTAAFVVFASCGLVALRLGAAGQRPELVEPGRDPLTVAYLRAFVAGRPGDAAMRLRLAREQLALGSFADAEHTVAPLLAGDAVSGEAVQLALEVSLAAWRAARAGTPERADAEARVLARLRSLVGRRPTLDVLTRAAAAALELGHPQLAARADERAAAVDAGNCAAWLTRAARGFLAAADPARAANARRGAYDCAGNGPAARALALDALDAEVAADRGSDALRFADALVTRFPDDREILARAEAVALASADSGRARRYAARLDELGAADQTVLERLFDLDLAASDLPAALRTARRLASQAPADPRFQRLVARVAGWAGQPRVGLLHWMWLARRGDGAALEQALHLAHALEDDAALAELLTEQARRQPLAATSLAELAGALERLGSPDRAVSLLEAAARRSAGDAAWEQLAVFHERRRDLAAAIAVRTAMVLRHGASLARSLQLARLEWASGHPDAALTELRGWSETADRGQAEYWQLLAELAWQQESDDVAERAYRALWQAGAIDPIGAERLVILSRDAGRPADAIRYGREGWARLGEPRLLLLAMDEAARTGRWNELARLRGDAARDEDRFAGSVAYWLLCAQLDGRRGRVADAVRDYRRALAIDAGSAAARSGLIWLLLDRGDRAGLAAVLTEWAAEADDDPGLWRAYAAGLERLGRPREAVAFYRREADADPDDEDARARYAAAVRRATPPSATTPAAAQASSTVTAELGVTAMGPVTLRHLGASARSEVGSIELEVRSALTRVSADDGMQPLERDAVDLLAGVALPVLGGRAELLGGAGVRRDGAVPRAALAYTRQLAPRAQLGVDAAANDAAPESAALVMEAVRTRAGASLALGSTRFYGRAAGEWKTWSTRSGTWLGRGGAATLELGVHARLADPEVNVRLQGGYQRNEVAAPMPDAPILPDELATLGVGVGTASWRLGATRLLVDVWLGWMAPPRRFAYRLQSGLTVAAFAAGELALGGYVANDNWMLGRGEAGITASLTYRFSHPKS